MADIIQTYERYSRQVINYGKSGVFCNTNVLAKRRGDMESILGVSQLLNNGRYFGLSSLIGRNKRAIFRNLRDHMWKKIQR